MKPLKLFNSSSHSSPTSVFTGVPGAMAGPSPVGCIMFSSEDLVRVHRFPPGVEGVVEGAIVGSWPKGIQRIKPADGGWEYKLRGTPWTTRDARPQHLLIAILVALADTGWHLLAAPCLFAKAEGKDTLLFVPGPPAARQFAIVSFGGSSARLVGGNGRIEPAFIAALEPHTSKRSHKHGAMILRLRSAFGDAEVHTRLMVVDLISALRSSGSELVAALSVTATPYEETAALTWVENVTGIPGLQDEGGMDMLLFAI